VFGTIAHLRPKAGQEQAVVAYLEEWERLRRPKIKGSVAEYLYRSEKNPGDLIMAVVFQDRESYYANAADPEQDRSYRQLRALLETDPTWEDGEIIGAHYGTREAGS